jgi:hypothetical protein
MFNLGLYHHFKFDKTTGSLRIAYLDDKNESSKCEIFLSNCDLSILLDAVTQRKVKVASNNSLGSIVYSENDTITIVPDIESSDREFFERIQEKKKNQKKFLYGNIIST